MHCFASTLLAAMFRSVADKSISSIWSVHVYTADLSAGCKSPLHISWAKSVILAVTMQSFHANLSNTAPALPIKWDPFGLNLAGFCRLGYVLTGTMVPVDAWASAQWCCQAFAAPSIFAFSGFEGAKRHRLCRPNGNPFGLNLAGVLPFRLRAHRYYGSTRCLGPMVLPSLRSPIHLCF